jgi:MYXO-CTERM domain-containing protein
MKTRAIAAAAAVALGAHAHAAASFTSFSNNGPDVSQTWQIAPEARTSNLNRGDTSPVVAVTGAPTPGCAVLVGLGMILTHRRRR